MKSSWTCCATRSLAASVLLALLAAPASPAGGRERTLEDLTNFLLGPDYSQWLVGPIAEMASEAEIAEYLRLTSDEAAAAYIQDFWARRHDPSRPWPQEQDEGIFERRALEADRLYTEGTTLGRRSDRGEIHILFGPPARIDFFPVSPPRRGNVEVWSYPRDAGPGLTGEPPRGAYFFLQGEDGTVAYNPSTRDRRLWQVRPRGS